MVELVQQDTVFVLDLGDDENRFHPELLAAVDAALDVVERAASPKALVTTATGRFFSNGLDLDWVSTHREQYESYIGGTRAGEADAAARTRDDETRTYAPVLDALRSDIDPLG